MKLALIIVFLLSFWGALHAQHEYDTWHFGEGAGVKFTGGVPTATRGPVNTEEGCSIWCDPATGNVILSSDGTNVYDASGSILNNGTDIGGGYSSTNSVLILPDPANAKRFYIFCAGDLSNDAVKPDNPVFSVSIADLSGPPPGVIIQKSTPLVLGTSEKVAGTMHCDYESFWVVAHDTSAPKFYVFRVTAAGVTGPIITTIGEQYTTVPGTQGGCYGMGYLKFSPSGKTLAMASPFAHRCEVFDFDLFTGAISNARVVDSVEMHYGLSFSPNERFLYTVSWTPSDQVQSPIHQFDLMNGFAKFLVGTLSVRKAADNGGIQRGPDGKLYVANRFALRVINAPNNQGAACDFSGSVPLINGTRALLGMPTVMDCLFDTEVTETCFPPKAAIQNHIPACAGACINYVDSSRRRPTQWLWEFQQGVPATFIGKTPPPICYATPGTFTVKLIAANAWGADTTENSITITPIPLVTAGGDLFLCDSARGRLSATGAVRYEWSPINGLSNQFVADPIVRVFTTTQYVVRGWDSFGCWDEDTVVVRTRLRPFPTATFTTSPLAGLAGSGGDIFITRSNTEYISDLTLKINLPHAAFIADNVTRGDVISDVMLTPEQRELTVRADLTNDTVVVVHGTLLLYGIESPVTSIASTVDTCIEVSVEPGTVYSDACFVYGRIVRNGQHSLEIIKVSTEHKTIDIMAEPRSEFELSVWTPQGELVARRSGTMTSPTRTITFDEDLPRMMFVRLRSGEVFTVRAFIK